MTFQSVESLVNSHKPLPDGAY